jgi:hypothetical protein
MSFLSFLPGLSVKTVNLLSHNKGNKSLFAGLSSSKHLYQWMIPADRLNFDLFMRLLILQLHFKAKLCNCTHFNTLSLAVVMDFVLLA